MEGAPPEVVAGGPTVYSYATAPKLKLHNISKLSCNFDKILSGIKY
jgi:hypothetical protein